MRVVVARCSVDYTGRLTAHLPEAVRLLMFKADGSVLVHADGGGYKPLNWMTPPTVVEELLRGMLGNDLLGFHIQYHCNNFLESVDRTVESRICRERFSVTRGDRTTRVRDADTRRPRCEVMTGWG